MIKEANIDDVVTVARLLYMLCREVYPNNYTNELKPYMVEAHNCLNDPKQRVFIEEDGHAFFVVLDNTSPLTPTLKRYEGTRVYIEPEYRHANVLKDMYDKLFETYPDGEILGFTEIDSEHIKVLDKRHTLIAKVYRLNRS